MLIVSEQRCPVCDHKIITSFDNPDKCPDCGCTLRWDSYDDDEGYLHYYICHAEQNGVIY